MTNKQEQILLRRQRLLDFIGAFDNGCSWPMKKMHIALECSWKQLRSDIEFLLKKGTIKENKVAKGGSMFRTLYSDVSTEYTIPTIVKYKVYTKEPQTWPDLTKEEMDKVHTNGWTAEQFYGMWHYEYVVLPE